MIFIQTLNYIENSILKGIYRPVTIGEYLLFTMVILCGMCIFTSASFGSIGLAINFPFLILIWLRPFTIVYKVLITLSNIVLPIALYIDSFIAEKEYIKRKNEAIQKFNNGDSSEVFKMGISPQQLSIPEGYILVCRRNSKLRKLDKIPENEWFNYSIYNGLERSDIKPYLSFKSGSAKGIRRYYLIKQKEFEKLKVFIEKELVL